MSIGKPFRYLFYVAYSWNAKTNPTRSPTILPTTIVTILLSLNALVLIQLGLFLRDIDAAALTAYPDLIRLLGYFCFGLIYWIVWMCLVRRGTYMRLRTEFYEPFPKDKPFRKLMVGSYVVGSVLLPWLVKQMLRHVGTH